MYTVLIASSDRTRRERRRLGGGGGEGEGDVKTKCTYTICINRMLNRNVCTRKKKVLSALRIS